jgi:hypothetical protein
MKETSIQTKLTVRHKIEMRIPLEDYEKKLKISRSYFTKLRLENIAKDEPHQLSVSEIKAYINRR